MNGIPPTRTKGKKTWMLAGAACLATPLAAAQAGGAVADSIYSKRHQLTLGAARQFASATISATPQGSETFKLSLKDLDIDERDESYYLEYTYRFRERWALLAGTYKFAGSGERTSERNFEYDGIEFTTGSTVRASLGVDAYIADVLYSFYRSDRFELMAGGGVHALDLSADLSGQVRISDFESEFRESGSTLLAPVPNVRAMALWTPAERFAVRINAGWLSARVDDYDGRFTYLHLRGSYELSDTIGLSLGYQVTDLDITQKRARSTLAYEVQFDGPTLTLTFAF